MAVTAYQILSRNAKLLKKGLPVRPIVTNLQFSKSFHDKAKKLGVPIYTYTTLDELIKYTECDVFCDEISKYYDSHRWQDLSVDSLTWISQGGKQGVKFYGSCQDFSQVAKAFRVITSRVFYVHKVMGNKRPSKTLGNVRFVWGIYRVWRINPKTFKGDDVTMETIGWSKWHRYKKKYTNIFDTSQKIERDIKKLTHVERTCDTCGKVHITHN